MRFLSKFLKARDTHADAWERLLEDHPELIEKHDQQVKARRSVRAPEDGACLGQLHEGRVWIIHSLPIPMALQLLEAHAHNDFEALDGFLALTVSQVAEAIYE